MGSPADEGRKRETQGTRSGSNRDGSDRHECHRGRKEEVDKQSYIQFGIRFQESYEHPSIEIDSL